MRVLLVEDDPGVGESLELGLALEGHEVRAFAGAEGALEALPGRGVGHPPSRNRWV